MDIERSIDIAAPRERVWTAMSDVEHWPHWTASVTKVERLDQGALGVGSRARVRQPRFPPVIWTVTTLVPGHAFEWQADTPGLTSVGSHRVDDAGDHASRVTLSLTWSGPLAPVIRRLFGNLSRRYVELEAQGLKRHCEATSASSLS